MKVSAVEAKTRFGELLRRVERGEEIVITRHDRPVARVVREGAPNLESVKRSRQHPSSLLNSLRD
jgi:antitoxin (DNA-binding transcriptional repressor) of toxin-antitoxin stability system